MGHGRGSSNARSPRIHSRAGYRSMGKHHTKGDRLRKARQSSSRATRWSCADMAGFRLRSKAWRFKALVSEPVAMHGRRGHWQPRASATGASRQGRDRSSRRGRLQKLFLAVASFVHIEETVRPCEIFLMISRLRSCGNGAASSNDRRSTFLLETQMEGSFINAAGTGASSDPWNAVGRGRMVATATRPARRSSAGAVPGGGFIDESVAREWRI